VYTGKNGRGRDPMFLHEDHAVENLSPRIRERALTTFARRGISWHDGSTPASPSNYLMDSMVSCANCLMPFVDHPRAAAALFASVVPGGEEALPIDEGDVIAFEWLGQKNYLKEKSPKRRAGAYGTSPDAHLVLRLRSGEPVGVLVEWKYTESYESRQKFGQHYAALFQAANGPIDLGGLPPESLFYEPFYQLARSVLLADAMEAAHESDVSRVVLILVVPDSNTAYRDRVTSPLLAGRGNTVAEVMKSLMRKPDRLVVTSAEQLFRAFPTSEHPDIAPAIGEISDRYIAGR
jgi:hypothetical protein